MFDLNPMDVLQQRKLKTVAPHFTELNISDSEIFEGIEDWIKVKLKVDIISAKNLLWTRVEI